MGRESGRGLESAGGSKWRRGCWWRVRDLDTEYLVFSPALEGEC